MTNKFETPQTVKQKYDMLFNALMEDTEEQRASRLIWIITDLESRIDKLEESWSQKIAKFFSWFFLPQKLVEEKQDDESS